MAQSQETGDPTVTVNNSISDLLAAPLSSDWTVESLAEQVLDAIAVRPMSEAQEFVLDRTDTTDRQSQRILRPLIACLAAKSAKESGMSPKLYGGRLSFKRPGPNGPVWIVGEFNNRPDAVCVALRRSASKPKNLEDKPGQTRSTGIPHYVPTHVDTWIALGSNELHPDYAARFSEMSTVACLVEPTEPHSIYFECKLEEQRHKWIESEKAGYDLGDLAIRQWALCHWQGFVRARWLEHLEGKRFWVE